MQKRSFLFALLFLAACNGGVGPVDSKKLLEGLDGPKIKGVSDTLQDAATATENQGNFAQASVYYQQMLEQKPDDVDIKMALADSFRRGNVPDKAIYVYDDILAKDPQNIAATEGKALALITKGDFESPTPLLESVLKQDPKRWKTLNALGILFATRNLQTEAQQYFTSALQSHENSPALNNNLGLSQALERKYAAAIATLQKASALSNSTTMERKRIDLNLALVYASAGKMDEAREIASHYLTGAALNNNLGLYAHLGQDDQLARAYLNMALTESKTYYPKAWDNLQGISPDGTASAPPAPKKKKKPAAKQDISTTMMPADLYPGSEALSPAKATGVVMTPAATPSKQDPVLQEIAPIEVTPNNQSAPAATHAQ